MATTKKARGIKTGSQKITRAEVETILEAALSSLKIELGDKKFKQRIRKAGKLLTHGNKKKEKGNDKPAKIKVAEPVPVVKKRADAKKPVKKKAIAKRVSKK
ncbi:MAG TPA: hypothetical protein PLA68_09075 [Panacibacter sp.]|nr:hypothetical protein [Panacibacter sp.]